MQNKHIIYIPLLDEGTDVSTPTEGIEIDKNIYQVLPSKDYDPEDEIWEFPPGSIVRCELVKNYDDAEYLRAVELVT